MPQTDALFAHVQEARVGSAADPDTPRISIDTKAEVKVGDFSRGGEAVKALDHDMRPETIPVPFGILELNRGAVPIRQPWFLFGHSRETSDFLADGLDRWWRERKAVHPGVNRRHIELDIDVGGVRVTAGRTGKKPSLIRIDGDPSGWPVQPVLDDASGSLEFENEDWKSVLGHLWFDLPARRGMTTRQRTNPASAGKGRMHC